MISPSPGIVGKKHMRLAYERECTAFDVRMFPFIVDNYLSFCVQSVKGVQELLSLILQLSKQHSSNTVHGEITQIVSSNLCLGLILNERFINIPAKVADPLLTSLVDELERIRKKHPVYNFDYLIMICKLHKPKGTNCK